MTICAICGSPRKVEAAHIAHKGMGGRGEKAPADWDDTVPLCAGTGGNTDPNSCHGAQHAGYLAVKRTDTGVKWMLTASAPAALKRRLGVKHDGLWTPARYLDADPDAIDCYTPPEADSDLIAIITAEFLELDATEAAAYRYKAIRLKAARDEFTASLGGREGKAAFTAWRAESLGLGDAPASKMLTVATYLGESAGRDLCVSYQYALARAVKNGKGEADALAAEAATMPMLDFTERYELVKPRTQREHTCTCPECGHNGPRSDFEED